MHKIIVGLVVTFALVTGCKKESSDGGFDDALQKYKAWTKAMCACKEGDEACAKKITEEQIMWAKERAKTPVGATDPEKGKAQMDRMRPIMDEFTKCSQKTMTKPPRAPAEKE